MGYFNVCTAICDIDKDGKVSVCEGVVCCGFWCTTCAAVLVPAICVTSLCRCCCSKKSVEPVGPVEPVEAAGAPEREEMQR